jgi:adenylate cyclase class 2
MEKPETFYRRSVFFMPSGHEQAGGWVKVRDEGDRITLSLKIVENGSIEKQLEVMLVVDNYEKAKVLLAGLGCVEKAYQETRRELWKLGDVEITIDEWPYLEPYIEVEGPSEAAIKSVSEKLGFNFSDAIFGAADAIISQKYNIPEDIINNKISRICFNEPNPYLAWANKK